MDAKKHAQIPHDAFRFRSLEPVAVQSAQGDEKKRRTFNGVPYSGKPITGHSFWGTVIFDLSSTSAASRTPALIDHNSAKRAGHAALSILPDRIEIIDGVLLQNEHGQAVAQDSDDGFPWQMSVYITPARIDELQAGAKEVVNGNEVIGPAVIFRNSLIREVSFTPTGYDPNTHAVAASFGSATQIPKQEEPTMTLEEAQAQATQFKAKAEEMEGQIAGLKASLDKEKSRADEAEKTLSEQKKAQREEAVKSLFSAIGKKFTDEDAKPYLDMSESAFKVVAGEMSKMSKAFSDRVDDKLFSPQATDGAEPEGQQGALLLAAAEKFSVE